MQVDPPNPAQQAPGLDAVPLFHAAWLFAAGIVVSRAGSGCGPALLLIALALVRHCVLWQRCARSALPGCRWRRCGFCWARGAGRWSRTPRAAPALAALSDGLLRTVEGTVVDAAARAHRARAKCGRGFDHAADSARRSARGNDRSGQRPERRASASERRRAADGPLANGCACERRRRRHFDVENACAPWFACCRRRPITIPASGAARIICWTRESLRRRRSIWIAWSGWGASPGAFWSCRVSGLAARVDDATAGVARGHAEVSPRRCV